jgi:hypothetical protein
MGSGRGFVSVCEEGVLELELTAEEVRAIAQPREARPLVAVRPVPSAPAREAASPAPKSGSPPRLANIGVTVGATVVVLAGVASFYSSGGSGPVTTTAAVASFAPEPVQVAQPAPVVVREPSPVRFANPFDPSEVFEFPAGTTRAAAREKVAELLIRRAQDRRRSIRRVAATHSVGAAK